MFTVVCPYCYHKINRKRLWFVCGGKPAPGFDACGKEVNVERLRETGYREQMFPTFAPPYRWWFSPRTARCPDCNAATGEHVCPCCNTPLPANFGDGWSPVIAMVGARATGKTIYLTVLAHQIQGALRERFEADVWLFGDEARQQLVTNEQMLFEDRDLPALTERPTNGRSEPLVFEWRRRHGLFGRFGSSYLSFLDTAGESLGTESGVAELQYLKSVDAMIILLDPYSLPRVRERLGLASESAIAASNALTVLGQVTQALRKQEGLKSNQRITKPVAVAFAKFDLLTESLQQEQRQTLFRPETDEPWYDETAGLAVHETMKELLLDWEAGIERHLQSHYEDYQYFALSSLGRPPDLATNKVSEKGIWPRRVPDPLEWLLSKYKLVPRRRTHA